MNHCIFFLILELNEESTTEFSSDTTEKLSTSDTITSTTSGKVNYRINLPIDPELLDYYPIGKFNFYIFLATYSILIGTSYSILMAKLFAQKFKFSQLLARWTKRNHLPF